MRALAIIDVETTGLNPQTDRVIELGIIRVEEGAVVSRYQQLVNPERPFSRFIEQHTGISPAMVKQAPTFREIIADIEPLLGSGLFIAHNAGFDYSFICAEYERLGKVFQAPKLCTAKLSRRLFPFQRRHNLDTLIQRFGIECPNRHRALDDAEVVWQFYKIVTQNIAPEQLLTY